MTSESRRADLALPPSVCLADLVPALARRVGVLEVVTAYRGYRAVTRDGRVLRPDAGLTDQGVQHGDVITIVPGAVDDGPPRCDDAAEAMAGLVERGVEPWRDRALRGAGLSSATVLLLVGAIGLLIRHGTGSATAAAAALAVLLTAGAVVSWRTRGATLEALVTANLACLHAAVAGLCWGWRDTLSGTALGLAGGAAVATGAVVTTGLVGARLAVLPAMGVGAVLLTTGVLVGTTPLAPVPVLTGFLVVVVVGSGGVPGLALSVAGGGRHARGSAGSSHAQVRAVDLTGLASQAREARALVLAASAAVGILLVGLAPVAASAAASGAAVPMLCSAVVMLRTRRYRRALDVLVGVVSGVLGLVSTLGSVLWFDGALRLPAALLVLLGGALVLGWRLWLPQGSARVEWLADRLESGALIALPPALVLALLLEWHRSGAT